MATLALCKLFCMNKKIIQFLLGVGIIIGAGICSPHAFASTNTFVPMAGTDASMSPSASFSATDLTKLATSDDTRIESNGSWPTTNAYDENAYLEFNFSGTVPVGATITNVSVANEFRRTGALTAAKLEIYNGASFVDESLTTGVINVDHTDTIDITSVVPTADKLASLKIRFLAYRDVGGTTQTSHDSIIVSVTYTLPVPLNTAPVVSNQAITTPVDASVLVTVSATDAESDPLTFSVFSIPRNGTLGSVTGNTVMYNPNGGLVGTDTFLIRAFDGKVYSTPATITVTLTHGVPAKCKTTKNPIAQVSTATSLITVQVTDTFGNPVDDDAKTVVTLTPFLNSTGNITPASATVKGGLATFTASALSQTTTGVASYLVTAPGLAQGSAQVAFYAPPEQPSNGLKIHIPVVRGNVNMTGRQSQLADSDIAGVGVADNFKALVEYSSTTSTNYDENQYTEFAFAQGLVPANATLKTVSLTARYQSQANFSKLEISNGTGFVDQPLALNAVTSAFANQTIDISSLVTSVAQVNNLVVRFLSKPSISGDSITNTYDFLGVDVTYAVPASPVATPQTLTTHVDAPLTVSLSGTDSLSASLTYLVTTQPTKGTLSALSGSSLIYTPLGQTGEDSFLFTVKSDSGESVPAKVLITLSPGQIKKIGVVSSDASATVDTPVTFTIRATDSFGNSVPLDASSKVVPTFGNGSLADSGILFASGAGTITGTASSAGEYKFVATIGSLGSDPVSVLFSARTNSSTNSGSQGETLTSNTVSSDTGTTHTRSSGGGLLLETSQAESVVVPQIETPQKIEQPIIIPEKKPSIYTHVSRAKEVIPTEQSITPDKTSEQTGALLTATVNGAIISDKEVLYFCIAIGVFSFIAGIFLWYAKKVKERGHSF